MSTQSHHLYSQDSPIENAKPQGLERAASRKVRDIVKDLSERNDVLLLDITAADTTGCAADLLKNALQKSQRSAVAMFDVLMPGIAFLEDPSSRITGEIDELRAGREDETIPTDFAYDCSREVVQSAYYLNSRREYNVPAIVPMPWVTTDDAGGIRMLWNVGAKKLRANFGATQDLRTYLYHESQLEHDTEQLNAVSLNRRLTWLTEP